MADLNNELNLNVPAAPSLTFDAAPAAPTLTLDPVADETVIEVEGYEVDESTGEVKESTDAAAVQ